jgi:hypothetical protein
VCAPFFVAHPVCLLENNSSLDSYQNVSTKEVVSSFDADVRILLRREFGSVRLAEGARGSDSEDGAQNGRSECDVSKARSKGHLEIMIPLVAGKCQRQIVHLPLQRRSVRRSIDLAQQASTTLSPP